MASYKKHPPLYPVKDYLGPYESWVLKIYGSRTFRFTALRLERFLEFLPYQSLDRYTRADVQDYLHYLLEKGNKWGTISINLGIIRRFFEWLIEEKNLPLANPAAIYDWGFLDASVYAETGKPLLTKAKSDSNTLIHVKAPAVDIGTPVLDENDFFPAGDWIDEFESCT